MRAGLQVALICIFVAWLLLRGWTVFWILPLPLVFLGTFSLIASFFIHEPIRRERYRYRAFFLSIPYLLFLIPSKFFLWFFDMAGLEDFRKVFIGGGIGATSDQLIFGVLLTFAVPVFDFLVLVNTLAAAGLWLINRKADQDFERERVKAREEMLRDMSVQKAETGTTSSE